MLDTARRWPTVGACPPVTMKDGFPAQVLQGDHTAPHRPSLLSVEARGHTEPLELWQEMYGRGDLRTRPEGRMSSAHIVFRALFSPSGPHIDDTRCRRDDKNSMGCNGQGIKRRFMVILLCLNIKKERRTFLEL